MVSHQHLKSAQILNRLLIEHSTHTFKVVRAATGAKNRRLKRLQQSRPDVDDSALTVLATSARGRHTFFLLLQQEYFSQHCEGVWLDGERPTLAASRVHP